MAAIILNGRSGAILALIFRCPSSRIMAVESTWFGEAQPGTTNYDSTSPDLGAITPRIGDVQPGLGSPTRAGHVLSGVWQVIK